MDFLCKVFGSFETNLMWMRVVTAPGSPPVNVRARPVSASTVVVQWEEPLQPNGVVKVCVILLRALSFCSYFDIIIAVKSLSLTYNVNML